MKVQQGKFLPLDLLHLKLKVIKMWKLINSESLTHDAPDALTLMSSVLSLAAEVLWGWSTWHLV